MLALFQPYDVVDNEDLEWYPQNPHSTVGRTDKTQLNILHLLQQQRYMQIPSGTKKSTLIQKEAGISKTAEHREGYFSQQNSP